MSASSSPERDGYNGGPVAIAGEGSNQRWAVGGVLILLGGVALGEGWRLRALRTEMVAGSVVGDDTMPLIVGAALLVLGILVAFAAPPLPVKVAFPFGPQRVQMLSTAGLLVGYWVILPYLGYTTGTAVVALGLYRTMGGYRWPITTLLAAATTGLLFLMFRVWLLEPLPTGWLGF
jgi:putative tricarboxylic transport membrane protein